MNKQRIVSLISAVVLLAAALLFGPEVLNTTPAATEPQSIAVVQPSTEPVSTAPQTQAQPQAPPPTETQQLLDEDGAYTTKDDVALYIYQYGHLPGNFITKNQARELGWQGGGLERYAPGKSIGGDHFGNHEGLLPQASDRRYTECDIDTMGADSRGAKRIVFSNDGLIFYTDDHYQSYTQLYGEVQQ